MYKILVVDDEQRIREVIREYAEFHGYAVVEAEDGMEAVRICREHNFDAVVMDIMMPKLDGFSTVKEIRKMKEIPTLMLSARGEEYDKLFGFELGVEDYVTKPFSPKELMARLNVLIRRNQASAAQPEDASRRFCYEGLEVDFLSHTVSVDGDRVDLTPKEFALLCFLVRNKNIALTRETLLSEVWGYDFFGDDRTVDTHIKMLRNSLGPYRDVIVTLRGVGYKFEAGY